MPEHRSATPAQLAPLESFLWHDPMPDPAAWARWCERVLPGAALHDAGLSVGRARRLHATLRVLQEANGLDRTGPALDTEAAWAMLDGLVSRLGVRPSFGGNGTFVLRQDDPFDPVGLLLIAVLGAVGAGDWPRFRVCRDPSCRASFFDGSKSGGKVWCAMGRCGSRSKMRSLRARRSLAAVSDEKG